MRIEFDPAKAENNRKRHGILFTDAATVLDDPLSVTIEDDSVDEERFVSIGMDFHGRVLVVVYTYSRRKQCSHYFRPMCDTERTQASKQYEG